MYSVTNHLSKYDDGRVVMKEDTVRVDLDMHMELILGLEKVCNVPVEEMIVVVMQETRVCVGFRFRGGR